MIFGHLSLDNNCCDMENKDFFKITLRNNVVLLKKNSSLVFFYFKLLYFVVCFLLFSISIHFILLYFFLSKSLPFFPHYSTGCPKKHGNSVTNSISSLLWISIVIPNFKSHNIIMSVRVYFMKRVRDCKDVSIMSP